MILAWGAKVSAGFCMEVRRICADLDCDPSHLMACMAFETGETFRADIRNAAGSGAVGLIQFMPSTARALGIEPQTLAGLGDVGQLKYVHKYLAPFKGRLRTLSDAYMAVLWPAAVGEPEGHVLFRRDDPKRPLRYKLNRGLDRNNDGLVTKGEAAGKVARALEKGLRPENRSIEP